MANTLANSLNTIFCILIVFSCLVLINFTSDVSGQINYGYSNGYNNQENREQPSYQRRVKINCNGNGWQPENPYPSYNIIGQTAKPQNSQVLAVPYSSPNLQSEQLEPEDQQRQKQSQEQEQSIQQQPQYPQQRPQQQSQYPGPEKPQYPQSEQQPEQPQLQEQQPQYAQPEQPQRQQQQSQYPQPEQPLKTQYPQPQFPQPQPQYPQSQPQYPQPQEQHPQSQNPQPQQPQYPQPQQSQYPQPQQSQYPQPQQPQQNPQYPQPQLKPQSKVEPQIPPSQSQHTQQPQPQFPQPQPQYPQPQPQYPQPQEQHPQPQQPQSPQLQQPQYPQPKQPQYPQPEQSQYPQPQQPQQPQQNSQYPQPQLKPQSKVEPQIPPPQSQHTQQPQPQNQGRTPYGPKLTDDSQADTYSQKQPNDNERMNEPAQVLDSSPGALMELLSKLNNKIKQLEDTQKSLNENIDMLQDKLAKRIPEKINTTASSLADNKPEAAIEEWKELKNNVETPQELQNATNEIVNNACDQMAPPQVVMDFVHQIPADSSVKDSAYNTLTDKMSRSEDLQGQMYWREMTPYCEQVAQDVGRNSPTTTKMFDLQDQMRLQAVKPIRECAEFIDQQQFQPAVNSWTNITQDIPENPNQLSTNMENIVTKAYAGEMENIQNIFHFILILPVTENQFREVAYNCLLREMNTNGHTYNPNSRQAAAASQLQPVWYTPFNK